MAGGSKFDTGKLRLDLIPIRPLRELGKVLTFGAGKYDDRNWEKGIEWSRVYGAALRHLLAFWNREDLDPESGLEHLSHALCCLTFLSEYVKTHPELDNRPGEVPHENPSPSPTP